jgi:uncharacterized membrane protein
MSERNTVVRTLHDLGLAIWFGGSLMGAVGLNGAASEAQPATEQIRLAGAGWKRWAPVQWAAIVAHGIGGVGLILGNTTRLANQEEGRVNTIVKTAVTFTALGATVLAAFSGKVVGDHRDEGVEGITESEEGVSAELDLAQRTQKVTQWLVPALTAVLIVLAAQQGEQQRPVAGLAETTKKNLRRVSRKLSR